MLGARRRNLRHAGGYIANARNNLVDRDAGGVDLLHTACHLGRRGADELADFLGRRGRALRQRAHLGGHHGKAAPRLAGPGRFHRGIERQDVGLKRQAVDDTDDLVHPLGAGLNGFNRHHRLGHDGGTTACNVTHFNGPRIGALRRARADLHGRQQLFNARRRLLQAGCLLHRAVRQILAVAQQRLAGMRHKGRIAAHIGHHARNRQAQLAQRRHHVAQFIAAAGYLGLAQIAGRHAAHRQRQLRNIAGYADIKRQQQNHQGGCVQSAKRHHQSKGLWRPGANKKGPVHHQNRHRRQEPDQRNLL